MSRVDDPRQYVLDPLVADLAIRQVLRESRLALQEALDLGLRAETAEGEAPKRFLQDRRDRLVANQQHAMTGDLAMGVAHRCREGPIATLTPRSHPVAGLLRILAGLILRGGGENIFVELPIGVVPEFHRRRFQNTAGGHDGRAQFEMHRYLSCDAGKVVDDDDMGTLPIGFQVGEHRLESRPIGVLARKVVREHLPDRVAAQLGVFAASRFLRLQAVAALRLRFA